MPVIKWWGEKPRVDSEWRVIEKIEKSLEEATDDVHLFIDFRVGASQIDLAIIKISSIIIVEVKDSGGSPLRGKTNGSWQVKNNDRWSEFSYGANPVQQIITSYYAFRAWLQNNKEKFLSPQHAKIVDFKDIYKLIVITPYLNSDSDLEVDAAQVTPPMGEIVGLDSLCDRVVRHSSNKILFSAAEIENLADSLGLSRGKSEDELSVETDRRVPQKKISVKSVLVFVLFGAFLGIGIILIDPFKSNSNCQNTQDCFLAAISSIKDGDTLIAGDKEIRLALVDVDESDFEASEFVESICPVNSVVEIDVDEGQSAPTDDNPFAVVYCDTTNLNEALLLEGFGEINMRYCDVSEFRLESWAQEFGCN